MHTSIYNRIPTSYQQAMNMLGLRREKSLGANTKLVFYDSGAVAVRYHGTDIVTFHASGVIMLKTGGWRSSTTKRRMNAALKGTGISIVQRDFVWYLVDDAGNGGEFEDGMMYYPTLDASTFTTEAR